jgi:hypothetical protein
MQKLAHLQLMRISPGFLPSFRKNEYLTGRGHPPFVSPVANRIVIARITRLIFIVSSHLLHGGF